MNAWKLKVIKRADFRFAGRDLARTRDGDAIVVVDICVRARLVIGHDQHGGENVPRVCHFRDVLKVERGEWILAIED